MGARRFRSCGGNGNGGRRNLWRRVVWQQRAVWPNRNGLDLSRLDKVGDAERFGGRLRLSLCRRGRRPGGKTGDGARRVGLRLWHIRWRGQIGGLFNIINHGDWRLLRRPAKDRGVLVRNFRARRRFGMYLGRPIGSPDRCDLVLSRNRAFEAKTGADADDSSNDHRGREIERAPRPDFLKGRTGLTGALRDLLVVPVLRALRLLATVEFLG